MANSKISVLIPVMNEVDSLNKTINIIENESSEEILEYIVILSPKSTNEAVSNVENLVDKSRGKIISKMQRYPGLGGAYVTGIESVSGEFLIMIASDLETDPYLVKKMIEISKSNKDLIITTSRWLGKESGFVGYGKVKLILNFIFQKWISIMFKSNLSDYTFGFRLYPTSSIRGIEWENRDFAFLLESILVPLKSGWKAIEIPHMWQPRIEGESNNSLKFFFAYFKTAVRIRISN